MIINQNQLEVRDLGFDDEKSFRIDEEEEYKIFSLLGNSIYSQKIESLVREVVSNSYDASVAAGLQNNPILVKYENNQIFFIDKGTGMSPEIIDKVYIRLGKSTKEQSNTQIGSFGVGKAATLSYATHYTLITNVDGVKYTYLISKGAKGKPNLSPLGECPTDEENGTTIIVDVPNADYNNFKNAVSNQLKYFKTVLTEGFNLSNNQTIIQGKTFTFRPDRQNIGGLEINFGQIYYPIQWDLLGIDRINVNCALYFPIDSGLIPIVSREQLENNESNKKLILDKIEEFKKEIQLLFDEKNKSVESFFEWRNKGNQKLEFGNDTSLDVSDIIDTTYVYNPLLNTQMNMKLCKNYAYYLFDKLFYYRKNQSKWNNDWSRITSNKKIFYAEKDVTNHRLAGIGWDGVVYKREYINVSPYDLKTYYDSSLLKKDPITNYDVEPDFDYRKEFEYLQDVIWNEIKENCVDAHSVEIPKKQSTRYKLADGEIRGKFSTDSYYNKKVVKMISELQKYRWRILTTDEEEYDKWKHFYAKFYDKKGYEVKHTFIAIFCSERDAKKIREICITPEEFLNSDFLKTLYLRREARNKQISTIGIQPFIKLHDMYKTKFQHVRHNNSRSTMVNFPYWLENILKEKYSIKHLEEMHERSVKFVNKYSTQEVNIELLRYKLLYSYKSKQLNKLKEKCQ